MSDYLNPARFDLYQEDEESRPKMVQSTDGDWIAAIDHEQLLSDYNELINKLNEIGEVYVYPSDWRSSKMGGPPDIDAYDKLDLSSLT